MSVGGNNVSAENKANKGERGRRVAPPFLSYPADRVGRRDYALRSMQPVNSGLLFSTSGTGALTSVE